MRSAAMQRCMLCSGDAGAPVVKDEIPVLHKAYRLLKDELRPEAVEVAERDGVVIGSEKAGYEIACVNEAECIFVKYGDNDVSYCSIQQAYFDGRIDWEKPLSCHLFPVRLKKISDFDYANFEYVDSLCSAACDKGSKEGIYLSDFLENRSPDVMVKIGMMNLKLLVTIYENRK